MRMLTDNPINKLDQDEFGFAPYAKLLANIIYDTEKLPFCIGIFAEWGAGKSSLMYMIKDALNNKEGYKTIWFNPWKYDRKEELWSALIQSILYKIIDATSGRKAKNKVRKIVKSTAWLAFKKSAQMLTSGALDAKSLDKLSEAFSKQNEKYYKHINNFEKDFEDAIATYTNGGKLVIFIDDLDRCLPQNAITILEALKLFIGNAKCVFVLGMDRHVIEQGIAFHFGEKIGMSGREYLDKIVQVPFFLPPVKFDTLKSALSVSKTANYSDQIWKLVELGLDGNPRQTKRFINSFYLLNEVLSISKPANLLDIMDGSTGKKVELSKEDESFYLAKLLVFQMAFPEFYIHLKLNPDAWFFLEKKLYDSENYEITLADLEEKPELKEFWGNGKFRRFTRSTAEGYSFPNRPTPIVVSYLINAISLFTPEDNSSKDIKKRHGASYDMKVSDGIGFSDKAPPPTSSPPPSSKPPPPQSPNPQSSKQRPPQSPKPPPPK